MRVQPKVIELIGDILIPILGFFLWDWSLYFILLFLLLDLSVREVVLHLKTKRDRVKQSAFSGSNWIQRGVISLVLLAFFAVVSHFVIYNLEPRIDFYAELVAFLVYEELGIPQGYLLGIIVLIMGYSELKRPELDQPLMGRWRRHMTSISLMITLVALVVVVTNFLVLSEFVVLFIVLVPVLVYRIFELRR